MTGTHIELWSLTNSMMWGGIERSLWPLRCCGRLADFARGVK